MNLIKVQCSYNPVRAGLQKDLRNFERSLTKLQKHKIDLTFLSKSRKIQLIIKGLNLKASVQSPTANNIIRKAEFVLLKEHYNVIPKTDIRNILHSIHQKICYNGNLTKTIHIKKLVHLPLIRKIFLK